MDVAQAVGMALGAFGVRRAFGVVGSGNFHFTNGLVRGGVEFVAARHEGGATTMADAYARCSGEVAVVSVHQGCGLGNATTGLGEAAKSRTPLLVVTGEATDPLSNFHIDQDGLARSVGASSVLVRSAGTALADVRRAYTQARRERRTVLLRLPLDVQAEQFDEQLLDGLAPIEPLPYPVASEVDVDALASALRQAKRPVFLCGRGARSARESLLELADLSGALLAEGAVAKGLFAGQQWAIGVSGGFSSPPAAELIRGADLVVGWGSALNDWTTAHGQLLGSEATLVQVDLEPAAIGRHRPVSLGILGDVGETAQAVTRRLVDEAHHSKGYRAQPVTGLHWRDQPYEDAGTEHVIDPRTLSIALDEFIPDNRVIGVDSGNFMGFPTMYLDVPDENGFCFTQAFQSIGLGLATTIGAALAQPARFPVAACGDGGFLMGIAELETAVRLELPMLIVVYNDHAYGAEVYFFEPDGHPADTVTFPDTDLAAIARGYGCDAVTVHTRADLTEVADRVAAGLTRPLVVDAKIAGFSAWWHRAAMTRH
ncbi:thiamine pyrophosphate-binding protein [Amycolatopsis jiangsuensis]|uniref:Thiamine pyrophosphate-dependent acetolactate synthase large subunit-like protein n=1 Tax=Amycolatopsis jiangsuensis TaxID=1181879 RepID=A0A840J2C4_9PSEU|nr:thiamine pyrophosphate-binding protein [Amycolatopsis jiangsuensis]MBB4688043.1 thiamine pyrophosphate-dependent acetolactate synthase large subunit-like protein [Amycolatopsis jiangsuensis]